MKMVIEGEFLEAHRIARGEASHVVKILISGHFKVLQIVT